MDRPVFPKRFEPYFLILFSKVYVGLKEIYTAVEEGAVRDALEALGGTWESGIR
jgi:hypothetical protein